MSVILEGILQASLIVSVAVIILLAMFRKKYKGLNPKVMPWAWGILGIRLCILCPLVYKIFGTGQTLQNPVYFSAAELMPGTEFDHYFTVFITKQSVSYIFEAWLTGALVFICISCIRFIITLRKIKKGSSKISNLYDYGIGYGLKCSPKCRKVEVRSCGAIKSPMLAGFYRKYLFVPEKLPHDRDMQMILKHEILHYERKDIAFKQFMLVCNAIHWFNPIIYLMRIKATELTELACDYEVVKDFTEEERQSYAELLYYTLEKSQKGTGSFSAMLSARAKAMEKRFNSILSTAKRKNGIIIFALTFAVIAILQPILYLDIRADAFQFSYIEIQHNIGESSYIETIPFADLYFLNKEQKFERVGDHDELVINPGEEIELYLSDEGETVKMKEGDVVAIQLQTKEYARVWLKIESFEEEIDCIKRSEIFGMSKDAEGAIRLNNYYEQCVLY